MKRWLRRMAALVAGFVVGSVVNMALVKAGPLLVPAPGGVDTSTMEGLKATMHLFGPQHFVFPFLAHALGTFAGALVACLLAPDRTAGPAYGVGVLFLAGGIAASAMLPAPLWFIALDVLLAYLPMAWLAQRLVRGPRAAAATPGG